MPVLPAAIGGAALAARAFAEDGNAETSHRAPCAVVLRNYRIFRPGAQMSARRHPWRRLVNCAQSGGVC
jgi:hypothetical protein